MTSGAEVVTAIAGNITTATNTAIPLVLALIGLSLAIFLGVKFYGWARKALK